jgi:hypothetical protein
MGGLIPWKTELIEGDPMQINGHELVPVMKARSILRRQVTFGTAASSGGGGGIVWLQPVAVIKRHSDGSEERIPITDETGLAIRGMLIGAMVLPILYLFIASVTALWRCRRS